MTEQQGNEDLQVEFKGRYTLFPGQLVPEINAPTATAFHVSLRSETTRAVYGLLCDPHLPQRLDALEALRGITTPGMIKFHDWGMAEWPPSGEPRFIIIAERPGGQRVMNTIHASQTPLHEEDLERYLLQPIVPLLKDLHGRGVVHRAIRPNNLFFSDGGRRLMTLGECVTAPPAYDQPQLFEPVESAMCNPIARGNGSPANDLYALGVTILFLLLGGNPVSETVDEDRLILNKMEFGSYAALAGQTRVPPGLMEALRGLLSDDAKERWTLLDLEMWMAGRRLSPKQPRIPQRSSRPFLFHGGEYFTARTLGVAFARDYRDAAAVVRSKALDSWLRRSLGDVPRADAIQAAAGATSGGGRLADDRLVARAAIVLDPVAPIRYRGFNMMVEGIGATVAAAQHDPELRAMASEVIAGKLPGQWVALQAKPRSEELRALQQLEKLPQIIDLTGIGYGFERCLYELNNTEACHSPLLNHESITDLAAVIPGLEIAARRSDRPGLPIDRHLTAFIVARLRKNCDDILRPLGSHDPMASAFAMLRLLITVQDAVASPPCPLLCQWLLPKTSLKLNVLHHRGRQKAAMEQLKQAAEDGSLPGMMQVLDNQELLEFDRQGFSEAVAEYARLDEQVNHFDQEEPERRGEAQLLGEQIVSTLAGILVSVTTAMVVFYLLT